MSRRAVGTHETYLKPFSAFDETILTVVCALQVNPPRPSKRLMGARYYS